MRLGRPARSRSWATVDSRPVVLVRARLRHLLRAAGVNLLFAGDPIGVYPLKDDDWRSTRRGLWYSILNGTPHIAYFHPQARMPSNLVHYGLIDAVAELAEI